MRCCASYCRPAKARPTALRRRATSSSLASLTSSPTSHRGDCLEHSPDPTIVVCLTSSSMHRQVPGSGAVAPPRKPFALRNGSPASSAMIRVATACPCHPIADADAWHRKHAIPLKRLPPLARGPRGSCFCTHAFELSCFPVAQEYPSSIQDLPHWQARTTGAWPPATLFIHPPPPKSPRICPVNYEPSVKQDGWIRA